MSLHPALRGFLRPGVGAAGEPLAAPPPAVLSPPPPVVLQPPAPSAWGLPAVVVGAVLAALGAAVWYDRRRRPNPLTALTLAGGE